MSIWFGLAVVLLVSVFSELVACVYFPRVIHWAVAFSIPVIVSVALYWLPNLSRLHDGELRTWFPLCFILWSVPSVIASLLAGGIYPLMQQRKHQRPSNGQ